MGEPRAGVDFFYDLRSPYAYFAWSRRHILEDAGAALNFVPVSIDVLLNLQAGRDPWAAYIDPLSPPKRRHLMADIPRMARHWSIPLGGPFTFRPRSKRTMCLAAELSARGLPQEEFLDSCFRMLWVEASDIDEDLAHYQLRVLSGLAEFSDADEAATLDKLTVETRAAYDAGVFGVPTFRHAGEYYFGSDRLDVLAKRLKTVRSR
jgi:2-hydroxychromene-2-carboxylate isomerase